MCNRGDAFLKLIVPKSRAILEHNTRPPAHPCLVVSIIDVPNGDPIIIAKLDASGLIPDFKNLQRVPIREVSTDFTDAGDLVIVLKTSKDAKEASKSYSAKNLEQITIAFLGKATAAEPIAGKKTVILDLSDPFKRVLRVPKSNSTADQLPPSNPGPSKEQKAAALAEKKLKRESEKAAAANVVTSGTKANSKKLIVGGKKNGKKENHEISEEISEEEEGADPAEGGTSVDPRPDIPKRKADGPPMGEPVSKKGHFDIAKAFAMLEKKFEKLGEEREIEKKNFNDTVKAKDEQIRQMMLERPDQSDKGPTNRQNQFQVHLIF